MMQLEIGFRSNGHPISLEVDQTAEELAEMIREAITGMLLEITDHQGNHYLIPSKSIAYTSIRTASRHSVGFGALS